MLLEDSSFFDVNNDVSNVVDGVNVSDAIDDGNVGFDDCNVAVISDDFAVVVVNGIGVDNVGMTGTIAALDSVAPDKTVIFS